MLSRSLLFLLLRNTYRPFLNEPIQFSPNYHWYFFFPRPVSLLFFHNLRRFCSFRVRHRFGLLLILNTGLEYPVHEVLLVFLTSFFIMAEDGLSPLPLFHPSSLCCSSDFLRSKLISLFSIPPGQLTDSQLCVWDLPVSPSFEFAGFPTVFLSYQPLFLCHRFGASETAFPTVWSPSLLIPGSFHVFFIQQTPPISLHGASFLFSSISSVLAMRAPSFLDEQRDFRPLPGSDFLQRPQ